MQHATVFTVADLKMEKIRDYAGLGDMCACGSGCVRVCRREKICVDEVRRNKSIHLHVNFVGHFTAKQLSVYACGDFYMYICAYAVSAFCSLYTLCVCVCVHLNVCYVPLVCSRMCIMRVRVAQRRWRMRRPGTFDPLIADLLPAHQRSVGGGGWMPGIIMMS